MVAISGSVQDLIGNYFENFVLIAKPLHGFFNSGTLVAQSSIIFRALSGNITGSLPETASTQQLIVFSANYTANGIYQEIYFNPVIIPNVASINISQLLTVILN
jgi:hypothetical protein